MADENVDYLDIDPPINGQNYCCLSFVSPEAIIDDGFCEYISYICTPEDSKMGGGCVEVQYPPNSMFPLEMGPEGDTISETPTYATLEECERDCKEKGEKKSLVSHGKKK